MLFNPDFTENQSLNEKNVKAQSTSLRKPSLNDSYRMFSAATPSPTRSMIKEANDHLQLLHQKVMELEKTVQEQAEALIKKDEYMQTKLRELMEMKDAHILEHKRTLESYEQRMQKLEQQCRDKDAQLEAMTQKCISVDELDTFVPALEKLLASLKKLSTKNVTTSNSITPPVGSHHQQQQQQHHYHHHHHSSKTGITNATTRTRRTSRSSGSKTPDRHREQLSSAQVAADFTHHLDGPNTDRSAVSIPMPNSFGQTVADLRIGRSFNINSNFSMSEDDEMDRFS